MKIRVLTQYPWSVGYGGAEIQARKYVEYASRNGVDIDFLDHYNKEVNYDILHIVGLTYNSRHIVKAAKAKNIKVAISPVYYTSATKARILALYLSVIKTRHLASLNLMGDALKSADVLLPNSVAEQKQLKKIFCLKDELTSFKVVHNGIDNESSIVDPSKFQSQYGINADYILSVAMVDKRKNTVRLIEGFLKSGSGSQLVIVGDVRDIEKSFIERFKYLVEANKDSIKLIPFIQDRALLSSAYAGAKMHAMPSIIETPGLSNLEAASLGCNLVVGECEPVREYFGNLPFYADPHSVDSIARAILAAEKESRSTEAKSIASKYHWEKIVIDLVDVYKSLSN